MKIRNLMLLAAFTSSISAMATTYYVSSTGNDANNGTSQSTAWASVARVQQSMYDYLPGDIILFQRGGTFPGELSLYANGTSGSPVTYGAYGTGEQPIISGGLPVTTWTVHQGNIYSASVAQPVKYLMVNNTPMTVARYPNTGWLRNINGSNTQINAGSALTQGSNYWNGATVTIRSTNWCFENATVTASNGGNLTFSAISSSLNDNDWGFFLSNKLSELDMAGEWYYDAAQGKVYLWAPNNANPNNLNVLGSIHAKGFVPGWQKHDMIIENLCFQGQKDAGISTENSSNVIVRNCTFRHMYKAISSSGTNNTYTNNILNDIYASAINIYDDNATITFNTLTDCGMHPGLGENIWGHMGINSTGFDNVIASNRLMNIGYIGIAANKNALIEKNVVTNAVALLNDGGGIAFDNSDGMIIRDNIVTDMVGSLESVATNYQAYYKICFGIYFGNTSLKNTLVQRNTVARCTGAGIHVDHTMVSINNQIKDNVLFDNKVQLSLSDFSNAAGPGATAPYHVPNFNDIYSGNIMYSIRPDQLCMRHYNVYSPNPVDFGTFTNNKYFSPYEDVSIYIYNTNSGAQKYYTLEQWQVARNEDSNSTRSMQNLNKYDVTQVHGANMIPNGAFDSNTTGWTGWPTEGQMTRDATFLDNGALKVNFSNNATYDVFFMYPDAMPAIQNNEWYRLNFSIQSNATGMLRTEVKGASQMTGPYSFFNTNVAFDAVRRDKTIIFQSDRTETARIQFINSYMESRYWMDNVTLERVTVQEVDAYERHTLLVNDQATPQQFTLTECWRDVHGVVHFGTITLPAYSSLALQLEPESSCALTTGVDDPIMTKLNNVVAYPNPISAGEKLTFTEAMKSATQVRLFDIAGRVVQETRMNPRENYIHINANIRPGAYNVVLVSETRNEEIHLVVTR
ncbi:MAG: right-handed parallel beta-helix repeat-containing protein [Flavobacteriales bacterium]|nr:right-handed parallel beta-helix repeat-containing protein [Flavobacteriales bacterium]